MKLVRKFFPDEINVNTVLEWIRNNLIKSLERFSFVVVKKSISQQISGAFLGTGWWPLKPVSSPKSVYFLVSTYEVCERLSVMHEPAGVVENLVQILQNTPILQDSFRTPPPKLKFSQILGLWVFSITEYPHPPENWNLARSWDFEYFQLQNTPPKIEI